MNYYASGAVGIHMPVINFQTLVTQQTTNVHSTHKNLCARYCMFLLAFVNWLMSMNLSNFCYEFCVLFAFKENCFNSVFLVCVCVFWIGFDESKLRSTCDPAMKCFAIPIFKLKMNQQQQLIGFREYSNALRKEILIHSIT